MGKSGTVVDNSIRETPAKGATVDVSTGKGTQYYEDNYRFTRDSRPGRENHWINQNIPKGRPGRKDPPPDAR